MIINFGYNKSEKNRITKDVSYGVTREGSLKNECNIINPTVIITGGTGGFTNINYFYIEDFGRYYFVTDIRSIRTGLVEITGHVDVLSSFADEIKKNSAIIDRTERKYNRMLNDGSFRIYQNRAVINKFPFPNQFTDYSYVLAMAGS